MVEPEPTPKNPRKARIQMDEELAQRLFEEEQAQFERDQRISRERVVEQESKDAALIEQMEDVQARMDADDGKKDDSSSKQAESSKKRPIAKHDEESVKKQKLQDDAEKEELKACLDIVQGDDIAIDVESLATKYPIVD
ncbi:hypothetical protein Tco_0449508 [Tanacetum coccineum]